VVYGVVGLPEVFPVARCGSTFDDVLEVHHLAVNLLRDGRDELRGHGAVTLLPGGGLGPQRCAARRFASAAHRELHHVAGLPLRAHVRCAATF
jgi:hypothetical protein